MRAVRLAADFFAVLAQSNDLPITPEDFKRRVDEFFSRMEELQGAANALTLAALKDEPCPQSLFAPWASAARIWEWRNAKTDPLPAVELNGKVCVRPSDFFWALRKHGQADKS